MKLSSRHGLLASILIATATLSPAAEQTAPETKQKPSGHSHRGPKQLMLENAQGASITLWKPDLTTQPLSLSQGGVTLPKTGMDNYHAVVAEKDWGNSKETVIRYEYLFGRPSEHSPSELAGAVKTDLEIVPAPIPREHFRYLANQSWGFQLRLKGQPKTQTVLILETANGTRLETVTDDNGYAVFRLPDDFPDIVPGQRDQRSAEFSVSAKAEDADITYETMLTASYRMDPAHWQSKPWGWLVVGIGFIAGGMIGRQRRPGGEAS